MLRSDNCSTQFKSRFVFKSLLDIAQKYNIQITWFYGEAGHSSKQKGRTTFSKTHLKHNTDFPLHYMGLNTEYPDRSKNSASNGI